MNKSQAGDVSPNKLAPGNATSPVPVMSTESASQIGDADSAKKGVLDNNSAKTPN